MAKKRGSHLTGRHVLIPPCRWLQSVSKAAVLLTKELERHTALPAAAAASKPAKVGMLG